MEGIGIYGTIMGVMGFIAGVGSLILFGTLTERVRKLEATLREVSRPAEPGTPEDK